MTLKYPPFKLAPNRTPSTAHYDLRLRKDGVVANIINNRIVSFDLDKNDDYHKIDGLVRELRKLGFTDQDQSTNKSEGANKLSV